VELATHLLQRRLLPLLGGDESRLILVDTGDFVNFCLTLHGFFVHLFPWYEVRGLWPRTRKEPHGKFAAADIGRPEPIHWGVGQRWTRREKTYRLGPLLGTFEPFPLIAFIVFENVGFGFPGERDAVIVCEGLWLLREGAVCHDERESLILMLMLMLKLSL
jgi:hypothetical protein